MKLNQLVFGFVLAASMLAHGQERGTLVKASRDLPKGAFDGTREPQELQLLTSGVASLEKRLQMIESAQKSIDMEFFIYNPDLSGRIITQALIKKAKEGVKVRLLVDSNPLWMGLDRYYSYVMGLQGIEVKFFNNVSMLKLKKVSYRSHRKLLLVDGKEAMTGGRNIADEYFTISYKYNFIDRDIVVRGSLVSSMAASFEHYWNSELSTAFPNHVEAPVDAHYGISAKDVERGVYWGESDQLNYQRYKKDLKDYLEGLERANIFASALSEKEELFVRILREKGRNALAKEYKGICNETYFLGDLPGRSKDSRVVFGGLQAFLGQAKKAVTLESAYLVLSKDILGTVQNLHSRGVQVELMTNGLGASDSVPVSAILYPYLKTLSQQGVKVYLHDGRAPEHFETATDGAKYARWGTHAKSIAIDVESETENIGMVGSFNFDPRSVHTNAEMAILCRGNQQFAIALQNDLIRHKASMVLLNEDGKPLDGQSKHLGASDAKIFFYRLAKPLVHLFENWL